MSRKTEKIKGYFLEHRGTIFGPVASEQAAHELAIYIVAKNKDFNYEGHGSVTFKGEPPYVCQGEIIIHKETKEVKRRSVNRLYQLEAHINPNAKQQQLIEKMIAEGEEINPDDIKNKKA